MDTNNIRSQKSIDKKDNLFFQSTNRIGRGDGETIDKEVNFKTNE